jgi:hypothetical protein
LDWTIVADVAECVVYRVENNLNISRQSRAYDQSALATVGVEVFGEDR